MKCIENRYCKLRKWRGKSNMLKKWKKLLFKTSINKSYQFKNK